MTDYDVRAAIREVVEHSDLSDPGEIAAKVAENVPAKVLRTVFTDVLREYVRIALHSYSKWGRAGAAAEGDESESSAHPAKSAKVSGYQSWARILRQPVSVEGNAWKPFGQCFTADVDYLASSRRKIAENVLAEAARYEKYAAAMREHGAPVVSLLPEEVGMAIEGGDR